MRGSTSSLATRRWRSWPVLMALGCGAALTAVLAGTGQGGASPARPTVKWLHLGSQVEASGLSYTASLSAQSGLLSITRGRAVLSVPLVALIGRRSLPSGSAYTVSAKGDLLSLSAVEPSGRILEQANLTAAPSFLEVSFASQLGPDLSALSDFFSNGRAGFPAQDAARGFTPDPVGPSLRADPTSFLGVHRPLVSAPFAPAPLVVEMDTSVGWLGVGLVHVPDATEIAASHRGAITVDYPLRLLSTFSDSGAGGTVRRPPGGAPGTWVKFPSFALTIAADPLTGLSDYRAALLALHQAPVAAPPGSRPGWWEWPLVDTWGQQSVTLAARTSQEFDSAWVAAFAKTWRQRFGVSHFTVIIDSQWQARLGSPVPSRRFGGISGMRKLIDQLHQEGLKVMLWWPLWIDQKAPLHRYRIDPTAPYFPARIKLDMTIALGDGPGDLDADGLKLDWGYLVPTMTKAHYSHPAEGLGVAALLRYMTVLSKDAWKAHPQALIDASAMAPQFGASEDALRLYDARLASTWSARAEIVAAVDPDSLIDGDGWKVDSSAEAISHIIGSAVFGTPAVYYATRWSSGAPISSGLAKALGAVLDSSETRGQGVPRWDTDGVWSYFVKGKLSAQTLGHDRAIAVYHYGIRRALDRVTVVGAARSEVTVPLARDLVVKRISASDHTAVHFTLTHHQARFRAQAGVIYQLDLGLRHLS